MTRTVQLGEKTFQVSPIPLGRLKKLLPAFNRCGIAFSGGVVDEKALDDLFLCLQFGLNVPVAELEDIPATVTDLLHALEAVAEVTGLKPAEGGDAGNVAATESSGTGSTPT